jgi:hypothetical protein
MELVDADADENGHLVAKVAISPRNYERLKEAFERGQLDQFGILSIQLVSPESAGPDQKGFAKVEEQKRLPRKKSDSTPDRP